METEERRGAPSTAALWAITAYQSLRSNQISPCRFTPSCSEYAREAIETKGFLKGSGLAVWRVMRCNPIGGHGVDLVPVKSGAKQ